MPHRPSPPRFARWRPSLATLAAIVACLACGTEAAAATATAGGPVQGAHGGHRCKCGMDCGATCCCAHDGSVDPPARPARSPAPGRPVVGPGPAACVTSAPCGGALPPSSGPLVRLCEPADRTALEHADIPPFRRLLAPPASDHAETMTGSRIDEPPERPADA